MLYVNDLLISTNEDLIWQMMHHMRKSFPMHDLSSVSFYLGMNIARSRELQMIDMHQPSYIRTIWVMFRVDEPGAVTTPMAMNLHKRQPNEEAWDPTIYQSVIGSLLYAITVTRPDITYAIGVLSWYNHDLSNEHMIALKREFRDHNSMKDWRR
jgi:hypothetical protein